MDKGGRKGVGRARHKKGQGKGGERKGRRGRWGGAGQWLGDGSDQEAGKRAICEQGKVEGEGGGGR